MSSVPSAVALDFLSLVISELGMEDDDVSVPDSPSSESGTYSPGSLEKQRASLQSYLNALPYECESPEQMQARLEYIVGRICICAETKNWLVLTTWDGMLQWYVAPQPPRSCTRPNIISPAAGCSCATQCQSRFVPNSLVYITSYASCRA